jgi:ribose 5-phosphate isomerase B
MRIAFAADHAGAGLKAELMARLAPLGHEMIDLGGDGSDQDDDYPDFAKALGLAVLDGRAERGILVCGSGVGAAIAASKIPGIRAGLCHDTYSAGQGVEHDDMNVLALGGRIIGIETAVACAHAFLDARFSGEPRHQRRVDKVNAIEADAAAIEKAHHARRP